MTRRPALIAFAAVIVLGGAALMRAQPAPWLVNETGSVPRGVYQRTNADPQVGALVVAAPPASARPYMVRLGVAEDAQLLKRVAAGPGEVICRDGGRVAWRRGAVMARHQDRQGRALPAWAGCRRLAGDEFLLLGDSAMSFDGRYFGPVTRAAIHGVYREVWRW